MDKPKKDNQDQESFEEAIEEMALTERQVSHTIQQQVGDGFLELKDLIEDYAPRRYHHSWSHWIYWNTHEIQAEKQKSSTEYCNEQ